MLKLFQGRRETGLRLRCGRIDSLLKLLLLDLPQVSEEKNECEFHPAFY